MIAREGYSRIVIWQPNTGYACDVAGWRATGPGSPSETNEAFRAADGSDRTRTRERVFEATVVKGAVRDHLKRMRDFGCRVKAVAFGPTPEMWQEGSRLQMVDAREGFGRFAGGSFRIVNRVFDAGIWQGANLLEGIPWYHAEATNDGSGTFELRVSGVRPDYQGPLWIGSDGDSVTGEGVLSASSSIQLTIELPVGNAVIKLTGCTGTIAARDWNENTLDSAVSDVDFTLPAKTWSLVITISSASSQPTLEVVKAGKIIAPRTGSWEGSCTETFDVIEPPTDDPPEWTDDPDPGEGGTTEDISAIFITELRRGPANDFDDIWHIWRYDIENDSITQIREGTTADDTMEMAGIAYRPEDTFVYRYQGQSGVGGRILRTDVNGDDEEVSNPNTGNQADDIVNTVNRDVAIDQDANVLYISHSGSMIAAPLNGIENDLLDGPGGPAFKGVLYDGSRYIYATNEGVTGEIYRWDKNTTTQAYDGTFIYYAFTKLVDGLPSDVYGIATDGSFLYVVTEDTEDIYRFDLDGSNQTLLVSGDKARCRNMVYHDGHLYWVAADGAAGEGYIRRCAIDGSGLETIHTFVSTPGAYGGPFGIDIGTIDIPGEEPGGGGGVASGLLVTYEGENVVSHEDDTIAYVES